MRWKKLAAAVGLVVVGACTEAPTSPTTDLSPQLGAVTANTPFENDFAVVGVTTCTGDPVTGWETVKGHVRSTSNKNGSSYTYHAEYQLDLVGASGRKYTGRGVRNQSLEYAPGYDNFISYHYKLVAQGEDGGADELWATQVFRFHFTPNGDIQQQLSSSTLECR